MLEKQRFGAYGLWEQKKESAGGRPVWRVGRGDPEDGQLLGTQQV